ncbi:MAG: SDR family oxidoreductase [Proteobacteria bacterium]|nr:SDR family oxidoreductase [Pseudomonadota bacterium]MCP4917194.1 SDR family oxidoreductase [Pseudomonadota bacterium]
MNVLVTGSSRGIGRAIAVRLARPGGTVVVNYLQNDAMAEETAEMVRAAGAEAVVVQGNVRDEKDLKRMAGTLDRYDALVHNAAIGVLKPWDTIRANQWDLTLESSVRPFWLLTKHVGDRLVDGGSIVGLSSLGSRRHVPGYAAMGAAKGALEALTRQLAFELAPRKIRVNTVCGGLVNTDALKYFPDREKLVETTNQYTPLGRIGEPDDIAKAVELLLMPQASWITGQILVADGGWSLL